LGKRELAVRLFVGSSGFCLHVFWVSPIVGTHDPLLRVDGASVRYGFHILDLLPTRSAPADIGYSAEECAKRNCTATVAHARFDSRQSFKTLLTLGMDGTGRAHADFDADAALASAVTSAAPRQFDIQSEF